MANEDIRLRLKPEWVQAIDLLAKQGDVSRSEVVNGLLAAYFSQAEARQGQLDVILAQLAAQTRLLQALAAAVGIGLDAEGQPQAAAQKEPEAPVTTPQPAASEAAPQSDPLAYYAEALRHEPDFQDLLGGPDTPAVPEKASLLSRWIRR
jgi:hypothetical protein